MRHHPARRPLRGTEPGTFFSLGGLLARVWRTRSPVTPWVCASSVLTAGAIWDAMRTGGPVDFVLLGLAGYELVIGLTEEPAPADLAPSGAAVEQGPLSRLQVRGLSEGRGPAADPGRPNARPGSVPASRGA